MKKVLIIRQTELSEIALALSLPSKIKEAYPECRVHWCIDETFTPLLKDHPFIDEIHTLRNDASLFDQLRLGLVLRKQAFSHVYDTHGTLATRIFTFILAPLAVVRKPQDRLSHFIKFHLRRRIPGQFRQGQQTILDPLRKWNLDLNPPTAPQLHFNPEIEDTRLQKLQKKFVEKGWGRETKYICLSTEAENPLSAWHDSHWRTLIMMREERFVVLNPGQNTFMEKTEKLFPDQVVNLSESLTPEENAAVISKAEILITHGNANLHLAEQLGKKCIALMGPQFLNYPCRTSTEVLGVLISCRPCSANGEKACTNKFYQECMVRLDPKDVSKALTRLLGSQSAS